MLCLPFLYMYLYFQWIFSIHLNIEIHFYSCNCFTNFMTIFSFCYIFFYSNQGKKMFMVGNEIKGDWSLDSFNQTDKHLFAYSLSFSCWVLLQFKLAFSTQIGVCKLGQRSSHLLMVNNIIIIIHACADPHLFPPFYGNRSDFS